MKKTLIAVCALLTMSAGMLSGAEKRIPVVWKSSLRPPYKNFQTYAFGFLEEKEEYTFVFQIKNLTGFLQAQRPFLTCYFNADKNLETGLYSGKNGWDVQFNLDLLRNTLAVMIWRKDSLESTYSFSKGEFAIYHKDDQLFLSVKKNIFFKNVKFVRGFSFAQLIASPELEKAESRSFVETAQATSAASFGKQAFILPDLRLQKLMELSKGN